MNWKTKSEILSSLVTLGAFVMFVCNVSEAVCAQPAVTARSKQLHAQAFEKTKAGDYRSAIELEKKALAESPNYPDALFNLGSSLMKIKDYKAAHVAYSMLLSIQPNDEQAQIQNVFSLIGAGMLDEARRKITSIRPQVKNYAVAEARLKAALSAQTIKQVTEQPPQPILSSQPKDEAKQNELSVDKQDVQALAEAISDRLRDGNVQAGLNQAADSDGKTVTLHSLKSPTGLSSDGTCLFAANYLQNEIVKICNNGTSSYVLVSAGLISGPSALIYDELRSRLLVSNYKAGTVVSVNAVSGETKLIAENLQKPYAMHLDSTGRLYISEQGRESISYIQLIGN